MCCVSVLFDAANRNPDYAHGGHPRRFYSARCFPTSEFSVNQTGRINLRRRLALAAAYTGFGLGSELIKRGVGGRRRVATCVRHMFTTADSERAIGH